MAHASKKIGILFGMEDTFPWALMNAVTASSGGEFEGAPVSVSYLGDRQIFDYAAILDRISHDVKFYRVYLKCAAARGTSVIELANQLANPHGHARVLDLVLRWIDHGLVAAP